MTFIDGAAEAQRNPVSWARSRTKWRRERGKSQTLNPVIHTWRPTCLLFPMMAKADPLSWNWLPLNTAHVPQRPTVWG